MSDETSPVAATTPYPAYVEFTVRMNVDDEWEFKQLLHDIKSVTRRMSTIRLVGDEAAVQVLHRMRPGARPIESDQQDSPPFTFEQSSSGSSTQETGDPDEAS